MELDKRILEGKRPLTCYDLDEAKKYVGKDCYFSSKFESFENLSKVPHTTLHNIDDTSTPFWCYGDDGVLCYACFILPCEWVKQEPKAEEVDKTKLDKRIRGVLGAFDTWRAEQFVGKECYFTDELDKFSDLDNFGVIKGTLGRITGAPCWPYEMAGEDPWPAKYIVPRAWVEPRYKQYFDVLEMLGDLKLKIGDVIHYRYKDTKVQYAEMISGTTEYIIPGKVCLGGTWWFMHELFDSLEIYRDNEWKPFGLEQW